MTTSDKIARFILHHLGKLTVVLLVLMALIMAGTPGLKFSSDNQSFFGGDNQEFEDLQQLGDLYAGSHGLLFMIAPPDGEAFAAETLSALQDMTADTWQTPYALRVDSVANFTHSQAIGDEIIVEPLLDEVADITPEVIANFQKVVTGNTEIRNRLISDDLQTYGINLQVILPDEFEPARDEVVAYIEGMRSRWMDAYPGFDVRITGGLLGGLTLAQAARLDIVQLVPMAFLAVICLLLLFLRSFVAVASSAAVVITGTLATFGFAGHLGIELTAGTAISPLAVMVLTSASCIHLILSWYRALDDTDRQSALHQAISENLAPILVTTITTAIGFLGLNFAQSPPLQNMGNIVGFGLIIGMFAVFTILPLGLRLSHLKNSRKLLISNTLMRRLAHLAISRRRLWMVVFPVATVLSIIGIFRIGYDDNLIRYFDQRFQFRQDAEVIKDRLTGLDSLVFSFESPEDVGVFDANFLRDIDAFTTWLETQDTVVSVTSLTQIVKRLNKSMNGDDPAFSVIADTREANAQLMMFYELSLPVGLDLNSSIDVDRVHTRVSALQRTAHSDDIRNLAQNAESWMQENTPNTFARASGISIAFARISERNNSQILIGLIVVLFLVSLILMGTLRNLRMGLVSLAPNLLPAILAFGIWGFTFADVNLGSTVVTTMTFGIVVDDTVHFLMHYLQRRKLGRSVNDALHETFNVVGSAIIITSVCLATGFAIMASSGFAINQHLGALTAIVIGFALLADLFFLPALLCKTDKDAHHV